MLSSSLGKSERLRLVGALETSAPPERCWDGEVVRLVGALVLGALETSAPPEGSGDGEVLRC